MKNVPNRNYRRKPAQVERDVQYIEDTPVEPTIPDNISNMSKDVPAYTQEDVNKLNEMLNASLASEDFKVEELLEDTPQEELSKLRVETEDRVQPEKDKIDIPGVDGVKLSAGDRSIALEKLVGLLLAAVLMFITEKLFGADNKLKTEEAVSMTEPVMRMTGRRVQKHMTIVLPLNKLDRADKADVEEVVAVTGLYIFRLLMKLYEHFSNLMKNRGQMKTDMPLNSTIQNTNNVPFGYPMKKDKGVVFLHPTNGHAVTKEDLMAMTGGDFGGEVL